MRIQLFDRRIFWLALLIALAFHALVLSRLGDISQMKRSAPVELQTINPETLEKIRRQWRQKEKALLLNRDPSLPKEKEAPKDARYESDRNTRVAKEQRAKVTQIVPRSGSKAASQMSQPLAKPRETQSHPLKTLGVRGLTPEPPLQSENVPAQDGGDQTLLDKALPEGSENLLNTQESIYYAFYSRVYEAVGPLWQSLIRSVPYKRRIAEGDYTTLVEVVFDSEGAILRVIHHRDSGVAEFDQAVDVAWKKVGRLPNPPQGILRDGIGRTGWNFTVNVGSGFNIESLPPERQY